MKLFRFSQKNWGFSLVEVALALGICSFCLIGLMGLVPVGITSNQTSIEQTAGTGVAVSIVADLQTTSLSTAAGTVNSPRFQIPIPGSPGTSGESHTLFFNQNGEAVGKPDVDTNSADNPRYRATVVFTTPLSNQRTATVVRVLITWPALADRVAGLAPKNYSGSYETVLALNRN